jgi:hypothetical protein
MSLSRFRFAETGPQRFFELAEELQVFGHVSHIHKHADQIVAVFFTLVFPTAVYCLDIHRSSPVGKPLISIPGSVPPNMSIWSALVQPGG